METVAKKALAYLEEKEGEMLALLARLVDIDNRTTSKEGVDEIGHILVSAYEALGFQTQRIKQEAWGDSLFLRRPGQGSRLLLIGHLDSVFPASMLEKTTRFRKEGNLAYGPGVVDMKACLVGCLYAVQALVKTGAPLPQLSLLLAGDEELGSPSIADGIAEEGRAVDFCLVTEGARPGKAIVLERKGLARADILCEGVDAHAGNEPEKGISALLPLCHRLPEIARLNRPEEDQLCLVTQLCAGEAPNVVPQKGTATVDLRFSKEEGFDELQAGIEAILGRPSESGARFSWQITKVKPPMAPTGRFEELLQAVVASSKELGIPYRFVRAGGVTDGNTVASVGTATIDGMGPVGGMMCSEQEYLEVDTLVPCSARLAATISKLSSAPGGKGKNVK